MSGLDLITNGYFSTGPELNTNSNFSFLGSELLDNSNFTDTSDGWTLDETGGTVERIGGDYLTITGDGAGGRLGATQTFTCVVGNHYIARIDVLETDGLSNLSFNVSDDGWGDGETLILDFEEGVFAVETGGQLSITSAGVYQIGFTATATTMYVDTQYTALDNSGGSEIESTVGYISCRELQWELDTESTLIDRLHTSYDGTNSTSYIKQSDVTLESGDLCTTVVTLDNYVSGDLGQLTIGGDTITEPSKTVGDLVVYQYTPTYTGGDFTLEVEEFFDSNISGVSTYTIADGWTVGTGWLWNGSNFTYYASVGGAGNTNKITQDITLVSGSVYELVVNVTGIVNVTGSDCQVVYNGTTQNITSDGVATIEFTANSGSQEFGIQSTASTSGVEEWTLEFMELREVGTGRNMTTSFEETLSEPVVSLFITVDMYFDTESLYFWSGVGPKVIGGNTYLGAGNLLKVSAIEETSSISAKSALLNLSGVSPAILSLALSEPYQGRVCKIFFGFTDNPEDRVEMFSGYMDQMNIKEEATSSMIELVVENKLVDLERARVSRYNSGYQKSIYSSDKGFDFVDDLQKKKIVWGRKA